MRLARLVLAELRHRKVTALATVVALAAAVACAQFFVLLARAGEQETRVIQRDMGLNVLILPAATDLDRYWSLGYSEHSMPAEYIERVAGQDVANRLIPILARRVEWRGVEALLTGIAGETFRTGRRMKPVFGMEIPAGELVVGGTLADALALQPGAEVELLGESFVVQRTLTASGSAEDVRVYANLADAQRLLDLEGRVNEIQALECQCAIESEDPLELLRAELEPLLPGTQVLRKTRLADARRHQRLMAERTLALATPVLVVLCGLWIGTLALLNVRERRQELGVLRALGYGSGAVAAVVLGRPLLLGVLGALVGSGLGAFLAGGVGAEVFRVSPRAIEPDATLVFVALVAAPGFAALASLIPAMVAVTQDPAVVLRDE